MAYKKGDFIGTKYEVYGTLGKGGFGVVYLVYSHETKAVYALKTFHDEYFQHKQARERFQKEAQVWVNLDRHPYIVRANFVEKIAERLYIGMEYVAPNGDGLNTLEGYLVHCAPDVAQSLRWAIQFCHGMEYAYSRGIRCHRDIKPANILISQNKTLKISDFGLAGVFEMSASLSEITLNIQNGIIGLSWQTMDGLGFGTPTHMPLEQFTDAGSCDERSDIYSFGVVLYQMASNGMLPFLAPAPRNNSREEMLRFWQEMQRLHSQATAPRLSSSLFPTIERCLSKDRGKRYQTFVELRGELVPLLREETGEVIFPPELKTLEAWEWSNKGISLAALGRQQEALDCFNRALAADPQPAIYWSNKGNSLARLGRDQEALDCCDRALAIDPQHADAWNIKSISLIALGQPDGALECYDRALAINPRHAAALYSKGTTLTRLGQHRKALDCYDRALAINPLYGSAWSNKGFSFDALGQHQEALDCYDRALAINPQDEGAWNNKANSLYSLGRHKESLSCCDRVLAINSKYTQAWTNKGLSLVALGRHQEAVGCFDQVLAINPQLATAWSSKGNSLASLGLDQEAVICYDKVLAIDPRDAKVWRRRAVSLAELGRDQEALDSCKRALVINPNDPDVWLIKASCEKWISRWSDAAASYRKFIELAAPSDVAMIADAREQVRRLKC